MAGKEESGRLKAQASTDETVGALLGLYRVLLPAEGDFTEAEQAAMDEARRVLSLAGVDLDAMAP